MKYFISERQYNLIKEQQNENVKFPIHLRRRLESLPKCIKSTYLWLDPKRFDSFEKYLERVIFSSSREFTWQSEIKYDESTIEIIEKFVKEKIVKEYLEDIWNYYENNI